jgi:hypothetical protein
MRRVQLGRSMTDHDVQFVRSFIARFSAEDIEAAIQHLDGCHANLTVEAFAATLYK